MDTLYLIEPFAISGFISAFYVLLRSTDARPVHRIAWCLFVALLAPFAALAAKEKLGFTGTAVIIGAAAMALLYELLHHPRWVLDTAREIRNILVKGQNRDVDIK